MKFEVVNERGVTEMSCTSKKYIPSDSQLQSMVDARYKFKMDGKCVTRKRIKEILNLEE